MECAFYCSWSFNGRGSLLVKAQLTLRIGVTEDAQRAAQNYENVKFQILAQVLFTMFNKTRVPKKVHGADQNPQTMSGAHSLVHAQSKFVGRTDASGHTHKQQKTV